jgi:signal transduction histidine kinase
VRQRVPLRAYVLGLVVLFVAVAVVNVVYQRQAALGDARRAALASARFGARTAAREIAADLGVVRAQVSAVAANPQIARAFVPSAACSLQFGGAGAFSAGHLDIVARNGTVACSSPAPGKLPGYRGAGWLAGAIRAPMLAGPLVDTRTGQPVVAVTAPVPGRGVVAGFLDLRPLGPGLAATLSGARHLEFEVTTGNGAVVLARSVSPGEWSGRVVAGTPFAGAAGQVQHRDLDGISRLYGQAVVPGTGWRVFAGDTTAQAFGAANRLSNRQIVITLAGLAVFLAAALVLYRRITRPITALSAGVQAATGHLPAGPVPVAGPAEVSALAGNCNLLISAANRELEARSRLARSERLESLGQLAAGVAHDFNNLLAVIMNYAGFVAEETAAQPAVRTDADQIRLAAERAARLTKQLLIFARREPAQPQPLDMNTIVADMHDMLARSIGEQIELAIRPAAGLPVILADRGQIEQVLLNLAINARDAMPGGGTLTIQTRSADVDEDYAAAHPDARPGRYAELAVTDTGTGISQDIIDRVFEPFFTTKPPDKGTGLGLSTVYGIVTGTGGTMSVDSEEGTGTTFCLRFPAAGPATAPPPVAGGPQAQGNGETILVVEDEPAVLAATARMLRRNGYATLEAATADQALRQAAACGFQLLLTDSVMPGKSGEALADTITGLRPGVPVVFMSGHAAPDTQPGDSNQPPRLSKPFTQQALLDTIHAALHPPPVAG